MLRHARLKRTIAIVCLAIATFAIYAPRLADSSGHLREKEMSSAEQARSIAASGRDTEGRRRPLYFHLRNDVWVQPALVYVESFFLMLPGASESTIRWTAIALGALDVVLMYVLATRLFKNEGLALVAAALLMLTPAHFVYGRLAMDALYPVPFVTAWLLGLAAFLENPRRRYLFVATLFLGLGFYTHATSVLTMTACLLLTWMALYLEGVRSARLFAVTALGFILPLLLLAPWYLQYPRTYIETVGRWGVHPAYLRNPLDGLRALASWNSLTTRAGIFWDYFNPSYLFFTGGQSQAGPSSHAGVFLLPVAAFLVVGLFRLVASPASRAIDVILMLGFVAVPLVASTFNERQAVGNELAMLPFAILIATRGVERLLSGPPGLRRAAGVCLLVLAPIQFAYVFRGHFTGADTRQTTAIPSAR